MRTIYKIYLSKFKREGTMFFASKESAWRYGCKLVKCYGGYFKIIEYQDDGSTPCYNG